MDGSIYRRQCFFVTKIIGHHEDILANGAVDREGGVEHQGRFDGTVHILVGIRDGDGSDGRGETASDTCHHEGCAGRQQQHLRRIPHPPLAYGDGLAWRPVQLPHGIHQDDEQQHQIPVVHHLRAYDPRQVVLVLELVEDRRRGAAHGETEVDAVCQIDCQGHGIDDDIDPLGQSAPGRQQQDDDVEAVGHQDGCRVEYQAAAQHLHQMGECQVPFIEGIVRHEEHQSRDEIHDIGHPQVPYHSSYGRKIT